MQKCVDQVSDSCDSYDLTTSIKKTEVVYQPTPGKPYKGAGEYEAKRISEAEQKCAQRKARAKESPTEFFSSDLSCSICNRQFRAKIGLISHLRTHNL